MNTKVLQHRREGIYCPAGDFFVDPRGQVDRAIITHAHSDHARKGHRNYLCSDSCRALLQIRLGSDAKIESIPYGRKLKMGAALVSFHPAGHILGSSQVRIEVGGEVWVVSGDYKPQADKTCETFELVACHGFITECTFGLPIYHWIDGETVHRQINQWWSENLQLGKPSILFAYSLGKAQRVLAGLDTSLGQIFVHSAVFSFMDHYQAAGVKLPEVKKVNSGKNDFSKSIVVAPPAVEDSTWMRKFTNARKGFASGWMAIRGARRRRNLDRGFVLSDHADWDGLIDVIKGTGAEEVKVTHGNGDALTRYLQEDGINCSVLAGAGLRGEEEE